MDDTMNFGLTKEQAAQLNELLEECLQELRAGDEAWEARQLRIDALEAETKTIIARMQQRVRENREMEARSMNDVLRFGLTEEQAAQLSELIEECLQQMRATNAAMEQDREESARLRAETDVYLARLKEQAEKGWDHIEEMLRPHPARPVA